MIVEKGATDKKNPTVREAVAGSLISIPDTGVDTKYLVTSRVNKDLETILIINIETGGPYEVMWSRPIRIYQAKVVFE